MDMYKHGKYEQEDRVHPAGMQLLFSSTRIPTAFLQKAWLGEIKRKEARRMVRKVRERGVGDLLEMAIFGGGCFGL